MKYQLKPISFKTTAYIGPDLKNYLVKLTDQREVITWIKKKINNENKGDNKMAISKNVKDLKNEMKKSTGMSSPWITYFHKLNALFGEDPDIKLSYDEDTNRIIFRVLNQAKADALTALLPESMSFGNVVVRIFVIPANELKTSRASLIATAFSGNPIFEGVLRNNGPIMNGLTYVIFKKKVAQYYNDNLGDPNGNESCLYQDLAKDIFGQVDGEALCFCTSNKDE